VTERLAADEDDATAARRGERGRRPRLEDDERALVVWLAVDLDRVVERVERALGSVVGRNDDRRRTERAERDHRGERRRRRLDRRARAERRADDDVDGRPGELHARDAVGGNVLERRRRVLQRFRQRDPELQAVAAVRAADQLLRRPLRVDDAAPGRHPVDRPRLDPLDDAGRVAVDDRAFEQVGERRQPDVRMRADVVVLVGGDVDRPEVVEEDEGADRTAVGGRQQPAHHEAAAEVFRMRHESLQLRHGAAPSAAIAPV